MLIYTNLTINQLHEMLVKVASALGEELYIPW